MNKDKTNINFINGDCKISLLNKIIYLLLFLKEIIFEKKNKYDMRFEYSESNLTEFWKDSNLINYSPIRVSCDAYLINLLKNNFNIRKKINILDIGCGNGFYGQYIRNLGFSINYIGIDKKKHPDWKQYSTHNNIFFEIDLDLITNDKLKKINDDYHIDIVFSQSTLEHIKKDMRLIKLLSEIFTESSQIHFVPAVLSFLNYFTHGYRRYNIIDINNIVKMTEHKYNYMSLGNANSIKLYFSRFYKYYKKKHKLDFFNLYKFNKINEKDIKKYIFAKKNQYPIFYCIKSNNLV